MLQNNPFTATSLTAGVTYVITYDKFTRKFFVTGV